MRSIPAHPATPDAPTSTPTPAPARPWLALYFRCANSYQRVYRNAEGTAYVARCPKCSKVIRFAVGEGGTAQRSFEVSC